MRVGQLVHRITIQQKTGSAGTTGQPGTTLTTFATRWASIEPLRGNEAIFANQLQQKIDHRIVIRYLSGLTAKMQILFGSRTFNIRSIRNLGERDRWMELMCEERT